MSVDFFDCPKCGRSVCECGDYFRCEVCESKFCVNCQGDSDVCGGCPICSLEFISDEMMVNFLLGKLKMTRKKAEKEFREAAK